MNPNLPLIQDIRHGLSVLCRAELLALAKDSGVPFTTLWKIRVGETQNPGIETVRLFYAHMQKQAPAQAQQAQAATNLIVGAEAAPTSTEVDHA